jgi:hypothetical protein
VSPVDTTIPRRPGRPRVALVTRHWGEGAEEQAALARLVGGALARRAEVSVVHLTETEPRPDEHLVADSVFALHRVVVRGADGLRGGIVRAALGASGALAPARSGAPLLERLGGAADTAAAVIARVSPDAVVLIGHDQPYDLAAACGAVRGSGPRVTLVPLLGEDPPAAVPGLAALLARADAVASAHPGESRVLSALHPAVVPLDLALPMNRAAVRHRLFGVRWFGRYVVMLRGFPAGRPRHPRSISHELMRRVLGHVSVAEVDDRRWRITDGKNILVLPVNPTRVNLWRLMEHALMTIDLRPASPLGRETLESLLLGTPVVVPDASAAMEHARAADGGLWYRDLGECFDAARTLLDRPLRERLAGQAETYALAHHGDMGDFVERCTAIVLGR